MRKKNSIIILCIIVFLVSAMIFWGSISRGEQSTKITWATPYVVSQKTERLLNDALAELGYNVDIQFQHFGAENYYEEVAQELQNGNVDIAFCGLIDWTKLGERLKLNENLLCLNDYLFSQIGQELYSAYPSALWDSIDLDNKIFWICSGGNIPVRRAVTVSDEFINQYGIDTNSISYENLCDIVLSIINEKGTVEILQNPALLLTKTPCTSYVCSPLIPLVISEENDEVGVYNLLEDPVYVSIYDKLKQINSRNGIMRGSTGVDALFQITYYTTEGDYQASGSGREIVVLENTTFNPIETIGTCVGIAKTTKNPDIVFSVLTEIYTSQKLSDIFAYGEEFEDYIVVDGHAVLPDSQEYINPNIIFGNLFVTTPSLYQDVNKIDNYYGELNSMTSSRIAGFVFDGSSVTREIEQVTSIMSQYLFLLSNDPNAYELSIDHWKNLLDSAGLEIIKQEAEQQLQEWFAEN